MSTFDDPFETSRRTSFACLCGRHRSQAEHDFEARLMMQCAPVESASPNAEHRYRGVVASAVLRTAFPKR
jgi:nitrate/nitrite transport system substrate-binding protein